MYQMTNVNAVTKENPVGNANPIRGANFHRIAENFIKSYPVGTVLTIDEFDSFLIHNGVEPPSSREKGSDGWLAFMQRRHHAKYSLNKAGAHPRMASNCLPAFVIEQQGSGQVVVRSPFEAAVHNKVAKQIESLVVSKRQTLRHLLQSIDYEQLAPAAQAEVRMISREIDNFRSRIAMETQLLESSFNQLRSEVKLLLDTGKIVAKNGGFKALLSEPSSVVEEDDDDDAPF